MSSPPLPRSDSFSRRNAVRKRALEARRKSLGGKSPPQASTPSFSAQGATPSLRKQVSWEDVQQGTKGVSRANTDKHGFPTDPDLLRELRQFEMDNREKIERRDKRWMELLNSDRVTGTVKTNQMRELVREGIIAKHRAELWQLIAQSFNENKGLYENILRAHEAQTSWAVEDIEKDVQRTFNGHAFFDSANGKLALRRILVAYSWYNPSVGYMSSMNVIAGFFLLFMTEEQAFWLLATVVEQYLVDYFTPLMSGSLVDQRAFYELMREKCPRITDHLNKLRVSVPVIVGPMFLHLFIGFVPTGTTLRILDAFFLEGPVVLFRAALAIFLKNEKQILQCRNVADIIILYQNSARRTVDCNFLMKVAFVDVGDIPAEKFNSMRNFHRQRLTQELDDVQKRREVTQLVNQTNFDRLELENLQEEFRQIAPDGRVSYEQFTDVLSRVAPWYRENNFAMDRVFKAFDKNGDNFIDLKELASGLSILTKGSVDDKLRLCFHSFDLDESGFIERNEMEMMLDAVFRMFYEDHKRRDLTAFVDLVFQNIDINPKDNRLSFEEFKNVIHVEPRILQAFSIRPDPASQQGQRRIAAQPQQRGRMGQPQAGRPLAGGPPMGMGGPPMGGPPMGMGGPPPMGGPPMPMGPGPGGAGGPPMYGPGGQPQGRPMHVGSTYGPGGPPVRAGGPGPRPGSPLYGGGAPMSPAEQFQAPQSPPMRATSPYGRPPSYPRSPSPYDAAYGGGFDGYEAGPGGAPYDEYGQLYDDPGPYGPGAPMRPGMAGGGPHYPSLSMSNTKKSRECECTLL